MRTIRFSDGFKKLLRARRPDVDIDALDDDDARAIANDFNAPVGKKKPISIADVQRMNDEFYCRGADARVRDGDPRLVEINKRNREFWEPKPAPEKSRV